MFLYIGWLTLSLLLLEVYSINSCLVISVSDNGSDVPSCLAVAAESSCLSLDFVLQNLPEIISENNSCVRVDIHNNQTLTTDFRITTSRSANASIQLYGMNDNNNNTIIGCIEGVEIVFNGVPEISLSNMCFKNCGTTAAVTIHDSADVIVKNCAFVNSLSTGLVITNSQPILYPAATISYMISDVMFIGNAGNSNSQVNFIDSQFLNYNTYNRNASISGPQIAGGGLNIDLKSTEPTNVSLRGCSFNNNRGWIGGGAYINTNSFSEHMFLQIVDCKFIENEAVLLGGGLYIGATDSLLVNPEKLNLNIDMENVIFSDNSASHAGGLAYQTKGQWSNITTATINITSSNFTSNSANLSGAAIGLFKWEAGVGGMTIEINFQNCSWTGNSIYRTYSENSTVAGVGVIYSQGIPFGFKGTTTIMNNYGTAILASSVQIYMHDIIIISHNSGIRGGAISLVESSRMIVQKGLNLTFAHNHADLVGGAVHHVFPVLGVVGQNEYCVFIYYDENITDPFEWEADIYFINNTALISGLSLFLSSPDSCKQNNEDEIFTENKTFHFTPSYTNQVTTSPVRVSFESSSITCSQANGTNCFAKVMLGEELRIKLTALDSFNNAVKSFASIDVGCVREDGTIAMMNDCDYELNGTKVVEFNNKQQKMSFHIIGKQSGRSNYSKNVILTWQLIELPSLMTYLNVEIVECYLGYVYNPEHRMCECYTIENAVTCNDTDYSVCVHFGHWFGSFAGEEIFASADCPFGSCDYTVNGECPNGLTQCGPDGSAYQFYCKLPRNDPNRLCLYNKGGVMCSECQDNYSPTYANLKCVADDKCHKGYVVIQVILYILYLSVAVFLVLLVAKFDLRIGSGQIYCLVFYFSVFKFFVGGVFPSEFLYVVEIFFTGLVQFNPEIFGMIPLCSGMKVNNFGKQCLQLINPIVLALTIFAIVYVSSKWPRYAILRNTRMGINAVCIMLYLCFISITQISLTLLTPVKFPKVTGVYTSLEPTVKYFHSIHIFYGIVAILLQLVLVLPFLCLLLFAPFLIRFRRLNLTRIKPILDEFQACYKDKYRYFAGYYLACRQLIFLMSFINLGAFAYIYILQILSILILTFHLLVQPYKKKSLNILDGLLILDLVLLSLLHGNTAAIVFDNFVALKIAFIYILVLLPVVYFVILCFSPLFRYLKTVVMRRFNKTIVVVEEDNMTTATTAGTVASTVIGVEDSSTGFNKNTEPIPKEREPLLFSNRK